MGTESAKTPLSAILARVKPQRTDIAAPLFPPDATWIGDAPKEMERLTAKGPVLVHFFEAGELSGVRTLPYLREWHSRYGSLGLTVLGVHTPRSPMIGDTDALSAALARLEVEFPVALDADYRIWQSYGCGGWPSLFLWGRGGVLRWFHFGEGEYEATEREIQEQFKEAEHPDPVEPLRDTDRPGAKVIPPTAEMYPGGDMKTPWSTDDGEPLWVEYDGAGAYASFDGQGEVIATPTGGEPRKLEVTAPGVYQLDQRSGHERREIRIDLPPTVRAWAVAFTPAVADPS